MKTNFSLIATFLIIISVISCKKYELKNNVDSEAYASTPTLPESVENYVNSNNDNAATLGRVLFYDRNLSLNNSVACGSCHQQAKAFCDNLQFSVGLEDQKTPRNSPSLFAKSGRMFWDGRATNLSDLVLRPIQNHVEMKFENLADLSKKILSLDYYAPLFQKAFGSDVIDSSRIRMALAEFLRNFDFSNNKFSRSVNGQYALNASEQLGKSVFFGKGKCSNCHHIESQSFNPFDSLKAGGYGFTDQDFNIGLETNYDDNGLGVATGDPSNNGKFMVPVLLNVEYTAPYMHDGRFKTLEEVVEHYNSGIQNHPNLASELRDFEKISNLSEQEQLAMFDLNRDGEISEDESEAALSSMPPLKLNLNPGEKKSLVDFLKTLSDPSIFTDKKFKNPFTSK